jgi:hypothetical protein
VLDLNAKVKVIEASKKDKLIVKQIVGKFIIGRGTRSGARIGRRVSYYRME